jgi:hypothetical protein
MANPVIQAQMAELDASICEKIGDSIPDSEVDEDLTSQFPEVLMISSWMNGKTNMIQQSRKPLCPKLMTIHQKPLMNT